MSIKVFRNIMIGVAIAAILSVAAITVYRKNIDNKNIGNESSIEGTSQNSGINTSIQGDETGKAHNHEISTDTSLRDGGLNLETMRHEYESFIGKMGIYAICWISDTEYFVEVYNTNKEAFVQYQDGSNTIIVFNNKNMAVQFGVNESSMDYVLASGNIDVINQIGLAIDSVEKGIGTFQSLDISDKYDETTYEFAIDLNGFDEIREFYSQIDKDSADLIIEMYKNNFEYLGFMNDNQEMSLRIVVICNETSGLVEAGIQYYSGNEIKTLDVQDGVYIYEVFNKYFFIPDWRLDQEWYDTDYASLVSSTETVEKCQGMLDRLIINLKDIVNDYFNKNYTVDSDIKIVDGEAVEHEDSHELTDDTSQSGDYQGEGDNVINSQTGG